MDDGAIAGTIKDAMGVSRRAIKVTMQNGRQVRLTLFGNWEAADVTRITRAINDGVRLQDEHHQEHQHG